MGCVIIVSFKGGFTIAFSSELHSLTAEENVPLWQIRENIAICLLVEAFSFLKLDDDG